MHRDRLRVTRVPTDDHPLHLGKAAKEGENKDEVEDKAENDTEENIKDDFEDEDGEFFDE